MEFTQLLTARYSVRAYKNTPVEEEKLHKILEAARLAPTAANRQPFKILVIYTPGREEELQRIYSRNWFVQAPIVICVCSIPHDAWSRRDGKNYADVDATIAMDHLILAAANEGLGTCWIAAFSPEDARDVLQLPDNWEPVAFTPLGYPADEPRTKNRKPLEELVRFEK
ncbi:nitroreductase family protein [candidate division KSB1 bacterium]|nr:nitroreductase family protein [candidate division KSB1 bacterium]